MSGENIDEFSLCEEDANKILLNGQSEDKNDKEFWAELFLRLLAKKRMLDSDNKRALDYRTVFFNFLGWEIFHGNLTEY